MCQYSSEVFDRQFDRGSWAVCEGILNAGYDTFESLFSFSSHKIHAEFGLPVKLAHHAHEEREKCKSGADSNVGLTYECDRIETSSFGKFQALSQERVTKKYESLTKKNRSVATHTRTHTVVCRHQENRNFSPDAMYLVTYFIM